MSDYIDVDDLRVGPAMVRNWRKRIAELEAEVDRLRRGLEQYADRDNWCRDFDPADVVLNADVWANDPNGWELADRVLNQPKDEMGR
jgi:hypothetical protein